MNWLVTNLDAVMALLAAVGGFLGAVAGSKKKDS